MKPFLILQLRPETEASDNEFDAISEKAGLDRTNTVRIRLDSEALPPNFRLNDYAGVIVGGGPGCVSDPAIHKSNSEKRIEDAILGLMPAIAETDFPFLGCCYGIGILAHHLGARVSQDRYGEDVGAVACRLTDEGKSDHLLRNLPDNFMAFVGHKEAVQHLPNDCAHLIASEPCPYQMIRYKSNVYATQFHPEADAKVFALRIKIYRDRGYFPPEDAHVLIEACCRETVHAPQLILKNFVNTYGCQASR